MFTKIDKTAAIGCRVQDLFVVMNMYIF